MKFFDLKYLLPLLSLAVAGTLQAQLLNGNFETGNLSHWTTFTVAGGNLGSYYGLPNVVLFDVPGTGTASDAAQLQAGQSSFSSGVQEGGGISQTVNFFPGQYSISADIAAAFNNASTNITGNSAAGLFTLLMDGVTISSTDLGGIDAGQTLRGSLAATISLTYGPHTLAIEITRPWLNGGGFGNTPLEYLDNIQVTQVPEPSGILWGSLGALALFAAARKSTTRQQDT